MAMSAWLDIPLDAPLCGLLKYVLTKSPLHFGHTGIGEPVRPEARGQPSCGTGSEADSRC